MNNKNSFKSSMLTVVATLMWVLDAGSSQAAVPKVMTVAVPSGGHAMAAKTDSQGTIHLVFNSAEGPQYANSRDNGKSLSKPVSLVDRASRKPGLDFEIWDMAVTLEGAIHVALGNNAWKLKLPQEEWGFFYTRLLPDETEFAPLKNLNHKPSEGFSLAVGANNHVTAVWMADKLYANESQDGGETFSATVEIDSRLNPCNCCTTSSVYGADGRLAILYREETNNERDMYLALWDQSQNKVTKTRVSKTPWKTDTCPMTYYSVTRSGDGYVVTWPTRGEIYFAKLDSSGTVLTPDETKTPGSNGMRTGVIAFSTSNGGTLVAWKKESQLGWQLYDDRGRPTGLPGSAKSAGNGVAGTLSKSGDVILFR